MRRRPKYGLGQGGVRLPLCPKCGNGRLDLLTLEATPGGVWAKGRIECWECGHGWEGTFEDPQIELDAVGEAIRTSSAVLEDLEHGELGRRLRGAKEQLDEATRRMNEVIRRVEAELLSQFPDRVATVEIEAAKGCHRILAWERGLFLVTVKGSKASGSPLLSVGRRIRTVAMDFLIPLYEELAA